MDASNIVLLIKEVKKFKFDVITVHDCFGVHANNSELFGQTELYIHIW